MIGRLGKLAPVVPPWAVHLRHALGLALAPLQAATWPDSDWRGAVYGPRILAMNDQISDCVVAASGNGCLVQSSYAGSQARMTDPEALANYIAATDPPYDPATHANDNGLVISAYLAHWNTVGITAAGQTNRLIGAAYVNPQDVSTLRRAIALGAGVLAGLNLPIAAKTQYEANKAWDVAGTLGPNAPGSLGGHGVWVLAADPYGLWIVTWGVVWRITWAAWLAWADEAWLCIDPLFLTAQGIDPAGVGLPAIEAAMPFAQVA